MLNEPIMRRGLSPEGQIIRQKHQSSLLNDEFGVTSQPVHRKIEKDFLKENVKKLREIQAKCRVQESRPITGNYPFKALRVKSLQNSSLCNNDIGNPLLILSNKSSIRERSGSTHSDYFSLTDDAPNELNEISVNPSKENMNSYSVCSDICNEHMSADVVVGNPENNITEKPPLPVPSFSSCSSPLIELQSTNLKGLPKSSEIMANKIYSESISLANYRNKDKLKELIEKIKNKKPACDTQAKNLWRDIEKQHKALLGYEENLSMCTSRSSVRNIRPVAYSKSSKQANEVCRSRSLDRISNQRQNQRINLLNSNSPVNKSMSTGNISLISAPGIPNDKNKVKNLYVSSSYDGAKFPKEKSFPDLNECSELKNNKYYFASNPELLSASRNQERNFCEKVGPLSLSHVSKTDICQHNLKVDDNLPDATLFAPIIAKKESSLPLYKQNILAKQRSLFLRSKSSGNLRITGTPPPTYKRGHIPKYLQARKVETQRMLQAAAASDPQCPPGHTPLPEHERKNTLLLLKKGLADVMQQISSLPVAQDTLRLRKVKQELDTKLNQIEEGIQIFSQPKVYVLNDA